MKYFTHCIILLVIISSISLLAQEIKTKKPIEDIKVLGTSGAEDVSDKVIIKDNDDHSLIEINDEGDNGGSITLPDASAISTTANKLYNLGGTLNWNGSALSTTASSLWSLSGSDIYYNSGNVGIGLSTPSYMFVVYGEGEGGALFQNSATGTTTSDGLWIGYYSEKAWLWNSENTPFWFGTNNTTRMAITENGDIGIGTKTPENKLDVMGRIGLNKYTMLNLPDQTDFTGTMYFGGGNAGYNLSHTSEYEGQYNTAVGYEALFENTSGHSNTIMGYWAGRSNADGFENTFLGWSAGQGNVSGTGNSFIGNAAGMWNTGNDNVFIGSGAGHSGGNSNIFIGAGAGAWHTAGSNNVIIGRSAGYNGNASSTNEGCVFIGYRAAQFETGNNKLYIENSDAATPLIWGDFITDDVIINGNLEVTGTLKDKGYVKISDVKTSGTNGGTFNSGSWQTRDINTEDTDTENIASVSSNQITLPAGTYYCRISCSAYDVGRHKSRLQNITASTTEIIGTSDFTLYSSHTQTSSIITGMFTITLESIFEIQHRCESSKATDGFGVACNFGIDEVYTIAEFWRKD